MGHPAVAETNGLCDLDECASPQSYHETLAAAIAGAALSHDPVEFKKKKKSKGSKEMLEKSKLVLRHYIHAREVTAERLLKLLHQDLEKKLHGSKN